MPRLMIVWHLIAVCIHTQAVLTVHWLGKEGSRACVPTGVCHHPVHLEAVYP